MYIESSELYAIKKGVYEIRNSIVASYELDIADVEEHADC